MPGPLDDYRAQYPQYKDVPDERLAEGMFNKYYAGKMSREQFNEKVGLAKHEQGSKFTQGVMSDDPDYWPKPQAETQTDRGIFLPLTVTKENGKDKAGFGVPGAIYDPIRDFTTARKVLERGAKPSETAIPMASVAQTATGATKFPGKLPKINPGETAAARASRMVRDEAATGTKSATPQELEAKTGKQIADAAPQGQDLRLADVGGENTRGLMRWAANTSPAAREAFGEFLNPRFRTQGERVSNWLRTATNNPKEAFVAIDEIKEAARAPNSEAYKAAFEQGRSGLSDEQGNPGLVRIFQSAWGEQVMREATSRWERKRLGGTTGGFGDYVVSGPNKGRYTLAFWDQVKRVLDSQSSRAKKANDLEEKRDVDGLRHIILDRLDKAFPLYADARGLAAKAFTATDAVEAGEKLMDGNWTRAQIEAVRKKVGPEEWGRVQLGFLSEYFFRLQGTADRTNIVDRLLNNDLDRARMDAVMGPDVREQLSAVLGTEALMQRTLAALGNSTTARQLAEMIRHNVPDEPGLAQQALRALTWSPRALIAHMLGQNIKARRAIQRTEIDHATADYVAELLLSKDPTMYAKGIAEVAKTPGMLDNIGGWYHQMNQNRLLRPLGQSLTTETLPRRQAQPGVTIGEPTINPQGGNREQGLAQPGIWQQ